MKNLSILAFTDRGRALAEQILSKLPEGCRGELYDSEKQTRRNTLPGSLRKKIPFSLFARRVLRFA